MPQSLHVLSVHIIFSTKGRQPWLTPNIRKRVWAYQSRILQNLECNSITIGGVANHVHVLCNLTKKFPTAKVIEILKKDSSKFIKSGEEIHPRSGRAPQEGDIPGRVFADFEKMRRSCGS
jgi:REP-associated tyrosine transposase